MWGLFFVLVLILVFFCLFRFFACLFRIFLCVFLVFWLCLFRGFFVCVFLGFFCQGLQQYDILHNCSTISFFFSIGGSVNLRWLMQGLRQQMGYVVSICWFILTITGRRTSFVEDTVSQFWCCLFILSATHCSIESREGRAEILDWHGKNYP